jgi:hypothetical protein
MDRAFQSSRFAYTQRTWRRGWQSRGAAVADKVALIEQLNQIVFAVARDGTRVTDSCSLIRLGRGGRGRIAGKTGKETLAQGTEWTRAGIELLGNRMSLMRLTAGSIHT